MVANRVLEYIVTLYGVFVGGLLPLIYLHGRLYFRRNKFGFRVLLAYVGRLTIILSLIGVIAAMFAGVFEHFSPSNSIVQFFDTPWYFVGFSIGLLSSIVLCVVGTRQARKQHNTIKKGGH